MPRLKDRIESIETQETKLAYYSLLQYEPDHMRRERLNVAILLEAPSHRYRGAKFLRHMHKRVRAFDPATSERVIYGFAKAIERTFASDPEDRDRRPIDYNEAPRPEGLYGLIDSCSRSAYTLWRFTQPKALVVDASSSFEVELNRLYRRLVQVQGAPREEVSKDKDYVRKTAFSELQKRRVELTLDPPPVRGELFEENAFDAAHQSSFSTFLQFLSFDTATPSLDQTKAFITAKRDVGTRIDNRHIEYIAFIQPPELIQGGDNRKAHERAVAYLDMVGIRHVPVATDGFDRVAYGLQNDYETFRTALASP